MPDPTTDIFSENIRKELVDAWQRASKANNNAAADVAEAALTALDDAEAAVTKAVDAVSTAEAMRPSN